ncbi:unnamed protein product [Trichobilharzia regenti]|nr:unnamed protein product [Trichobilharzia regenti]
MESVHKVRKLRVDNSTYSHQGGHMKWSPSQSEDTSTSTTDNREGIFDYTYAAHIPKDEDDLIDDNEEVVTVHEGSAALSDSKITGRCDFYNQNASSHTPLENNLYEWIQ